MTSTGFSLFRDGGIGRLFAAAILCAALFASLNAGSAWAQTDVVTESPDIRQETLAGETLAGETLAGETLAIAAAIKDLSSRKFGKRQAAYRLLVQSGGEVIASLERAADSEDLGVAERCVRALVEIAGDKEHEQAAIEALDRLAVSESARVAPLAASEVGNLKLSDEQRAIKALEAAGVVLRRDQNNQPNMASVMRDEDLYWLQFLPSLRYVSLMQQGITDQGLKHLTKCGQIQSLTFYDTGITDAGLGELHQLPSLRSISVSGGTFTAAGIRSLAKVASLSSLMWHSPINEEEIRAIGEIKQVRSLSLYKLVFSREVAEAINGLQQMTRLRLSLTNVTDEQCEFMATVNARISLSLMGAAELTDKGWEQLSGMNLQSLSVFRSSLRDRHLPLIGAISDLESLSIYDAPITDEGVMELVKLERLRSLNLRGTEVSEEAGKRLQEKMPNLRYVRIQSQGIPLPIVKPLQQQQPYNVTTYSGKKSVHMRVELTPELVEKIRQEEGLHTLFMTRVAVKDQHLQMIAALPIKALVVDSDDVTDKGLAELRDHKSLEALTVTSSGVTDDCRESITRIPALTKLWIHKAKLTDEGTRMLIADLAERERLTWLNLSNCPNISNEALRGIDQLKSLKQLTFSDNAQADSGVLRHLDSMPNLTEVRLEGTRVQAADLQHLATLQIERLHLGNCQLQEGALASILEACPKVEQLGLAKSNVGDEDMVAIGKLKKLQWLWIYQTQVGDQGIKKLGDLQELKYVFVNASKVSLAGEKYFKEKHPDATLRRY